MKESFLQATLWCAISWHTQQDLTIATLNQWRDSWLAFYLFGLSRSFFSLLSFWGAQGKGRWCRSSPSFVIKFKSRVQITVASKHVFIICQKTQKHISVTISLQADLEQAALLNFLPAVPLKFQVSHCNTPTALSKKIFVWSLAFLFNCPNKDFKMPLFKGSQLLVTYIFSKQKRENRQQSTSPSCPIV